MSLYGGVINGFKNLQIVFKLSFVGEICNDDVEFMLCYENVKGEIGVFFGVNVCLLVEGNGKGDGFVFMLILENFIIVF